MTAYVLLKIVHILSGAVVDPKALDELIPDWREQGCPLADTPVTENLHWILTKGKKFDLPHFITPRFMHNEGTYTGSLGNLCRWQGLHQALFQRCLFLAQGCQALVDLVELAL